jgi:hypothetical protein
MTDATYDLSWLVTSAEHSGRGLGGEVLGRIEAEPRGRGGRTVRIETSSLEGKRGARRFHLHAGCEEVGLIGDFHRPGDDPVTLAKRLLP